MFKSDGDSSAYDVVWKTNDGEGPHGDVRAEKGECINHVAKRLWTALRKLRNQGVSEKQQRKERN